MNAFPHFNLAQIEFLCQDLQNQLIAYQIINCLAVSPYRLIWQLQKATTKKNLYFCFDSPVTRFHLVDVDLLNSKTSIHSFLDSALRGMNVKSIQMVNRDRIVCFELQSSNKHYYFYGEFFSKHPNCYLTTIDHEILFSLHPIRAKTYVLPQAKSKHIPPSHSILSHTELAAFYFDYEQNSLFQRQKNELENLLLKKLKKFESTKKNLEAHLQQCVDWEKIQHEADLIKSSLGQYQKGQKLLNVWDWLQDKQIQILLKPQTSIQDEMSTRYKQAKKLQKGIEPTRAQIVRLEAKIKEIYSQIAAVKNTITFENLSRLQTLLVPVLSKSEQKLKEQKKTRPYYEYFSEKKIPIWVGKNAKSNEILTFQLANGNDWWLHVKEKAGSHVIIRLAKGQRPDPETIQDAVQLALFHSKAKGNQEGEVCITQRKYVSRFGKGQVGKVQISQSSYIYARLNMDHLKKIKAK